MEINEKNNDPGKNFERSPFWQLAVKEVLHKDNWLVICFLN